MSKNIFKKWLTLKYWIKCLSVKIENDHNAETLKATLIAEYRMYLKEKDKRNEL